MPKKIDLIGQIFGRLTVIQEDNTRSGGHVKWLCKCNCGNPNLISVSGAHLRNNHTQSCGCLQKEKAAKTMKEQIQPLRVEKQQNNLVGKKFGLLTVIRYAGINKNNKKLWECKCDCGNIKIVSGSDLITQHTSSCGCLKNSLGELKIKEILINHNIPFIEQKTFETCKDKQKLKFDFYIDNKYLVEYDGDIHFITTGGWNTEESLNKRQEHDKIKNNWCLINHIPLIRINYTKLKDLTLQDLLLETTKYRVV